MADQSDVETALVTTVSMALYPDGADAPSAPGPLCRIYRGWPKSAGLNADLAGGRVNVTIFPAGGAVRNTTRYMSVWTPQPTAASLTASVVGVAVSFGGVASIGQLAGVSVDGFGYVYRTSASDTPASVAANLAANARQRGIVTLSGSTLTFQGAGDVIARVVADGTGLVELRRQAQDFRVVCWCPTPVVRDQVASIVDTALAAANFLNMPDGTGARLRFAGTTVFDQAQNALLYRRDLIYSVEYATTMSAAQAAMIFGDLQLGGVDYIN